MKTIAITRGRVSLVDDEDYEMLAKFHWYAKPSGKTCYASRGYWKNGRVLSKTMHHQILGTPQSGYVVDHIDRNGLNNQRVNLRLVTYGQSCTNRDGFKSAKTTSSYKGVSLRRDAKSRPVWRARFANKSIGQFQTELGAAMAYNARVYRVAGEHACLNSIHEKVYQRLTTKKNA